MQLYADLLHMHTPACPHILTLECTALILAVSAPYPVILVGIQCSFQAFVYDFACPAHCFCLFDLLERRACITDWEEELRVFIPACSFRAPIL